MILKNYWLEEATNCKHKSRGRNVFSYIYSYKFSFQSITIESISCSSNDTNEKSCQYHFPSAFLSTPNRHYYSCFHFYIYSPFKWVREGGGEIKLFCWGLKKGSLKRNESKSGHNDMVSEMKEEENFLLNRLLILIFLFRSFTVHFMQIDTQYWTTIA